MRLYARYGIRVWVLDPLQRRAYLFDETSGVLQEMATGFVLGAGMCPIPFNQVFEALE